MNPQHRHEQRKRAVYAGLHDAFVGPQGEASRPLCLCVPGGVPMYLARHGDGRLVKRMPLSGYQHAPDCPHHGPPAQVPPRRQEDRPTVNPPGPPASASGDAAEAADGLPASDGEVEPDDGRRATLLTLLHDLWIRADLTRWHPGFAGKRHWGIVRSHLLHAARQIRTHVGPLARQLYVPEVFGVDRAAQIRERRAARWKLLMRDDVRPRPSMVVIGEMKSLRFEERIGRAWLKHMPDLPFTLHESAYQRLERGFADELALWGRNGGLRMVCLARVAIDDYGAVTTIDLAPMVCTSEWIPVADDREFFLVKRLVEEGRQFKKLLHEPGLSPRTAAAVLLDLREPLELQIDGRDPPYGRCDQREALNSDRAWRWRAAVDSLPPLPAIS